MEYAFKVKTGKSMETVAVGRVDEENLGVAFVSKGRRGEVVLYEPQGEKKKTTSKYAETRSLRVGTTEVTTLAVGRLGEIDAVLAGLGSEVAAFDLKSEAEIWRHSVEDGVTALIYSGESSETRACVFCGGNCSVLGLDAEGGEVFWTVAGEQVRALSFDGFNLAVGSDDYEIRVLKASGFEDGSTLEMTETAEIHALALYPDDGLAFGLKNGTVGSYKKSKRLWRVKSKHQLTTLTVYSVKDFPVCVASGFENGALHVRDASTGALLYKTRLESALIFVAQADLRKIGDSPHQLCACFADGQIRGLIPQVDNKEKPVDLDNIQRLEARKRYLLREIRAAEAQLAALPPEGTEGQQQPTAVPTVPFPTPKAVLKHTESNTLDLVVSAEGMLVVAVRVDDPTGAVTKSGQALAAWPSLPGETLSLAINPRKRDVGSNCVLTVFTYASFPTSSQKNVVSSSSSSQVIGLAEIQVELPKFCSFCRDYKAGRDDAQPPPGSSTRFTLPAGIGMLAVQNWVKKAFLNCDDLKPSSFTHLEFRACAYGPTQKTETKQEDDDDESSFVAEGERLWLEAGLRGDTIDVALHFDGLYAASELVQDLATALRITDLEAVADLPTILSELDACAARVDQKRGRALHDAADANVSQAHANHLLQRLADARSRNDPTDLKLELQKLKDLNSCLVAAHKTRLADHRKVEHAQKTLNLIIQQAANLRVGQPKAKVVADARAVLKSQKLHLLYDLFCHGQLSTALPHPTTTSSSSNPKQHHPDPGLGLDASGHLAS